jgi:hypothetical protein
MPPRLQTLALFELLTLGLNCFGTLARPETLLVSISILIDAYNDRQSNR